MFVNRIRLTFIILLSIIPSFACNSAPDTSRITRKWFDVEYAKTSSAQKLDVYLPNEGEGPFPVIVFFHGGAFRGGDKADFQVASTLDGVNRGYAVVSVNYRMSGEAKFPAYIHDAKAAIRFVKTNAEQYKLNPNKIAVWGDSSGGIWRLWRRRVATSKNWKTRVWVTRQTTVVCRRRLTSSDRLTF